MSNKNNTRKFSHSKHISTPVSNFDVDTTYIYDTFRVMKEVLSNHFSMVFEG